MYVNAEGSRSMILVAGSVFLISFVIYPGTLFCAHFAFLDKVGDLDLQFSWF